MSKAVIVCKKIFSILSASVLITFSLNIASLGLLKAEAQGVSVTGVSAGSDHSCAVSGSGTAYCWGSNFVGQLGDGNTVSSNTPVVVQGFSTGVKSISAGEESTCALTTGGLVYCWGNLAGQSGKSSDVPVLINGLSGITYISAGNNFDCAVNGSGSVYCWGLGSSGQLGDGSYTNSPSPMLVSGISDAVGVSAGSSSACAMTGTGLEFCWGSNVNGLLGNGTRINSSNVPVQVNNLSAVTSVSVGSGYACAVADGLGYCWGGGSNGTLGNGSSNDSYVPAQVKTISNVSSISAGQDHTCAIANVGSAYCWGLNNYGELGTGNNSYSFTPVPVTNLSTATMLSAGAYHTCTFTASNTAYCWGYGGDGELGNNSTNNSSVPVQVIFPQLPVITSGNSATFTYNSHGSFTITANGTPNPAITETGILPNGLDFVDNGNGTATISGTAQSGTVGNYNIALAATNEFGSTNQNLTLTVNKAAQSISFTSTAPTNAVYGGTAYNLTATGGASGNPVIFTSENSSVCSVSGSTVNFVGAGTCTIDANQSGNTDYQSAAQAQQTFIVNKAQQTIIFTSTSPTDAVYDGPTYNVAATGGGSSNPILFTSATPSICSVLGSTVSFVGVGDCTINANQAGDADYLDAKQAQLTFSVQKASQVIQFTSNSPTNAIYNGPSYTVSVNGGVSANPVVLSTPTASVCEVSGSSVSFVGVGTCVIDANQAGNADYLPASQVQQSFEVNKAPQTITISSAAPTNAVYGGSAYDVVAVGGGSNNPVAFTSASVAVCTVSGSSVSFVGVGTCTIDANQAGNDDYLAAAQLQQSFNVNPAPQTINFTSTVPTNAVYSGPAYDVSAAGGASGNPVVFSSVTPTVCGLSDTTVSFVGVGFCIINANQAGNDDYLAAQARQVFNVGKAPTTLDASSAEIEHGFLSKYVTFSAKLTSDVGGSAVSGESITFNIQNSYADKSCTTITDSEGVASCSVNYDFRQFFTPVPSSYSAAFAGSADYASSQASGSVERSWLDFSRFPVWNFSQPEKFF